MAHGEIVQVFNRAPWPLKVIKDGREYILPPGLSSVNSDIVPYARRQNPVMGTEDPSDLHFESLVSQVAPRGQKQPLNHSLDPIPAEVLAAMPKERLDRSKLALDRQQGAVELRSNSRGANFPNPGTRVGIEAPTENMIDPSGALKQ